LKILNELPQDIDTLFYEGKLVSEENLQIFAKNITDILRDRLKPKVVEEPKIRMSKLGTPDRKLWYEHHFPLPRTNAKNALKFVYGDIIEQLILFLAKEAGHLVEDEQREFEIDGIIGHQDAKIDGTVVDVKSASSYAFRKFSERTIFKDDPFGYIAQLSAYAHANGTEEPAFIGVNKENGEICVLPLQSIDLVDAPSRIAQVKKIADLNTPRPATKCYEPIPFNKGDNLTLNKNCMYCPYKSDCWSDANNGKGLRWFQYAKELTPLVMVVSEPRVQEVFPTSAGGEPETVLGGDINTLG
jgi:hypothetical protein